MRIPALVTATTAVLVLACSVEASTILHRSLMHQIAFSQAIAIGKVTRIDPIPLKSKLEERFLPSRKLTVDIEEVLRGTPGKTVTVNVFPEAPIQVGSPVVLFVSEFGKDGAVEVYPGAQGLHALSTLKSRTGDHEADQLIEKAIRAAIIDTKDLDAKLFRTYFPDMGPKATAHMIALALGKNTKVRQFAISSLGDLKVDDETAKVLIPALKDPDRLVRSSAAHALARQEYTKGADAVADYLAGLPRDDTSRPGMYRYLAKADPQKYDYASQLREWLIKLDPAPHQAFAKSLKELPRGFYLTIQLNVDQDLKCQIAGKIDSAELARFMKNLEKLDLPTVRRMPFSCEITIGYDRGNEYVKVNVR